MYCNGCGKELRISDRFCFFSGRKLLDDSETEMATADGSLGNNQKEETQGMKLLKSFKRLEVIVLAAGVLVAILISILFLIPHNKSFENKAIAAVKQRVEADGDGNSEAQGTVKFSFSDIETQLLRREDDKLNQEGQIRVEGIVSYQFNGKDFEYYFGSTVSFFKGEYHAGTVSYDRH